MSAIDEIAAERRRQIELEGWTTKHDDKHRDGELAAAASHYARHAAAFQRVRAHVTLEVYAKCDPVPGWPWLRKWWKPRDPRSDLIRAGALIVAEIERLDRQVA